MKLNAHQFYARSVTFQDKTLTLKIQASLQIKLEWNSISFHSPGFYLEILNKHLLKSVLHIHWSFRVRNVME